MQSYSKTFKKILHTPNCMLAYNEMVIYFKLQFYVITKIVFLKFLLSYIKIVFMLMFKTSIIFTMIYYLIMVI